MPYSRKSPFASYLEKKMDSRAITVGQLSDNLGVDKSIIYKWLNSERIPSAKKAQIDSLCKILHLAVSEEREMRDAFQLSLRNSGEQNRFLMMHLLNGQFESIQEVDFKQDEQSVESFLFTQSDISTICPLLESFLYAYTDKMSFNIFIDWEHTIRSGAKDRMIRIIKTLLSRGIGVKQVVAFKNDDPNHNLRIFVDLWPLIIEYPHYQVRYLFDYSSYHSNEMLSGTKFSIQFGRTKCVISSMPEYVKYVTNEFEYLYENNSIQLYKRIDEDSFNNDVVQLLTTQSRNIYNFLDIPYLVELYNKGMFTSINVVSLFTDYDFDKNKNAVALLFEKDSDKNFLVIPEDLSYKPNSVRFILKKGFGVWLYTMINNSPVFINITEKYLVDEFSILFIDLQKKYNNGKELSQ